MPPPVIYAAQSPFATAPAINATTVATLWAAHNSSRSLPGSVYWGLAVAGTATLFVIPVKTGIHFGRVGLAPPNPYCLAPKMASGFLLPL